MIKWENLPERIKNEKTYPYYELLQQKKIQILWKRVLDFFCAVVLTVLLSPVMLLIAAAIKLDTKGPIFYRQTRVTRYGMTYRIFKFRTMITGCLLYTSGNRIPNDPAGYDCAGRHRVAWDPSERAKRISCAYICSNG